MHPTSRCHQVAVYFHLRVAVLMWRDCWGRKCTTELSGSVHHQTSTPHKSRNKMKRKKTKLPYWCKFRYVYLYISCHNHTIVSPNANRPFVRWLRDLDLPALSWLEKVSILRYFGTRSSFSFNRIRIWGLRREQQNIGSMSAWICNGVTCVKKIHYFAWVWNVWVDILHPNQCVTGNGCSWLCNCNVCEVFSI